MTNYLEQESELEWSPSEHQEDEDEAKTEAYLAQRGLKRDEETGEIVPEETSAVREVIICSCGSFTCGAITTFGHPVPLFKSDIEPIFGQIKRDRKALELKGGK